MTLVTAAEIAAENDRMIERVKGSVEKTVRGSLRDRSVIRIEIEGFYRDDSDDNYCLTGKWFLRDFASGGWIAQPSHPEFRGS